MHDIMCTSNHPHCTPKRPFFPKDVCRVSINATWLTRGMTHHHYKLTKHLLCCIFTELLTFISCPPQKMALSFEPYCRTKTTKHVYTEPMPKSGMYISASIHNDTTTPNLHQNPAHQATTITSPQLPTHHTHKNHAFYEPALPPRN
jgi:hypothetical protein